MNNTNNNKNSNRSRDNRPQTNSAQAQNEKVFAFIDSQNVNLSVQDKGWKLDWTAFRQFLQNKYNVSKAFLFIGYVAGNETLYSTLQQQGYIVFFKPTVDSADGVKGNIDVELVLRALVEFNNYDKAVIVTGDGDFHALVDHLESNHKLKQLIVPNKDRYSSLFKRFEGNMTFISSLKRQLEYKHVSRKKN